MSPRAVLLGAFFVSGASGLTYELVWSRYLALLLGHSAYAQVVVIAVYLGGMAVGAAWVGQRAARISRPLVWYAAAEGLLALFGLAFHPVFRALSGVAYDVLLPAMPEGLAVAAPWFLSILLMAPQSILLGATFPLMTGGLLRGFSEGQGRTVAEAYLFNSLGGAVGVLVAGLSLLPLFGTATALVVAAAGNLGAGALAYGVSRTVPAGEDGPRASPRADDAVRIPLGEADERLVLLVLGAAFLTAVASFMYEIGWIRMLSLLMGSATHSFELMLSAFILGLALGSYLVREWVDTSRAPLRLLGGVQWAMGFAALATLPLYAVSFWVVASAVSGLPADGTGYLVFNVVRYSLALLIMLPSTVMAGATLPLMTGLLIRRGVGERAVGWVYGINTFGSVTGVVAAGLILLPLLGLKGLLITGAALDMGLGVVLLVQSRREGEPTAEGTGSVSGLPVAAGVGTVAACVGALFLVPLDRATLTGGAFRYGTVPTEESREVLYYEDGRTSTVGIHVLEHNQNVVLTTNGKPDASLPLDWLRAASGDSVPVEPLRAFDAATQTVAPLVLLAHRPGARTAVNIGHGSGMSGDALLASQTLEELVTVEIEPAVVRASGLYDPANRRAFQDPRHRYVFDDARAYLAREGRRFDLILSEPSNPWVSGTATLFTEEFYRRVRTHLAPGGVFGQWLQIYEMDDRLLATVLEAVHRVFGDYETYLVGAGDLLIVAGDEGLTPEWSVFELPGVTSSLAHLPPFREDFLQTLRVMDRDDLDPLFGADSLPVNSDFHPLLEHGAERARFEDHFATGTFGLATDRFDLLATLAGRRRLPPESFAPPPIWILPPMRNLALAAWLGEIHRGERPLTFPPYPEWRRPYLDYLLLMERLDRRLVPGEWRGWVQQLVAVEAALHRGTAGWVDESFYGRIDDYAEDVELPNHVRAAVDFLHGIGSWDFREAAAATDVLRAEGVQLLPPGLLLDGGVVAYLKTGRTEDARALYEEETRRLDREAGDLRVRLLRAYIERASRLGPDGS